MNRLNKKRTLIFFTFPRVLNFLKLICGYFLSRIFRRPFQYGLPAAVSIEPTNRCNLHCPECPSGLKELSRDAGFIDPALFRSLICQLSPGLAWLNLYFQGEPFLHESFLDLVTYARSRNIFVSSSTNGHFLGRDKATDIVRSGLNSLTISVDGTDQQVYETYRVGGSLSKVVEGIRNLAGAKKLAVSRTPEIIIQFLVLRSNQHQIKDIRRKAIEWGGDKVKIKTAQFNDFRNGNPLMPSAGKYSRYRVQDAGYSIKNSMPGHCFRMWSSCVITWDGKVVPCCFDKDAKHQLGDLGLNSFGAIWKSEGYNAFRRKILKQRKTIDICSNCSEGLGMSSWL